MILIIIIFICIIVSIAIAVSDTPEAGQDRKAIVAPDRLATIAVIIIVFLNK